MVLSAEEKRERHNASDKIYRAKNKEKIKKCREANKEYMKEYRQTPNCKKSNTIYKWKLRGLICEDYDSLYCHYLNAENCDSCNVTYGEFGDGSQTFKCMDHNHQDGKFRNFLCCRCNILRG